MTVERSLLSGPDLGGGFLFQLSFDREASRSWFTYHAQEGGQDAQGPPKGPLGPLGFARTETACQFGGRNCWHREFDLPEDEAARVRPAYHRLRFVMAPMLEQRYGAGTVPVEETLAAIADRVLEPLATARIPVWVGGSAAAYLQGVSLVPRDIDLGTSREGAEAIGARLEENLIEPVAPTCWGPSSRFGGRAFVGTLVRGMRVEWAASTSAPAPAGSDLEWTLPAGEVPTVRVERAGRAFVVSRLEFALVRAAEHREPDRVRAIAERLRATGLDDRLLARLLAGAPEEARVRALLRSAIGPAGG